jgi:hypothetical protein
MRNITDMIFFFFFIVTANKILISIDDRNSSILFAVTMEIDQNNVSDFSQE